MSQQPVYNPATTLQVLQRRHAATDPLHALREAAYRVLKTLPFPTASSEFWRYTTPDGVPFGLLGEAQRSSRDLRVLGGTQELPKGVDVRPLATLDARWGDLLQRRTGSDEQDAVRALQLAAVTDAHELTVRAGVQIEAPLHLMTQSAPSSSVPLTLLRIERGASATVLLEDEAPANGLNAPLLEVDIEAGASLHLSVVQRGGAHSSALICHRYHVARDARLKGFFAPVSSRMTRLDADLFLQEAGSDVEFLCAAFVDGTRHVGLFPTQHHLAPHCASNVAARAVLTGRARSVYYGYIRVAEGAQKTDAYQSSKNLIISPDARADAIPNLRIQANDVKCSHGASVGQLGMDELFYLLSRGLRREDAERLLVGGFLADLFGRIQHRQVREFVQCAVMGGPGEG